MLVLVLVLVLLLVLVLVLVLVCFPDHTLLSLYKRLHSQGFTPAAEQNRREDKYGRRKNTKTFIAEMFPGHTLLAFHRGILRNVYKNTIQTCRNTKIQKNERNTKIQKEKMK